MKKITYTLICVLSLLSKLSSAQLADGALVSDFTFTDMNGVTQHLYDYLNKGQYVALDVSATWCPPCWEYHSQKKVMEELYTKHDLPGDKTWKVLFIEGDKATTDADMKGTGSNTQGDWFDGTPFPMCNPPSGKDLTDFLANYKIEFFPTLYLICPDKKVYSSVLNDENADWPSVEVWEKVALNCGTATGINTIEDKNSLAVYPNPATDQVTLSFNLNNAGDVKLQVVNAIGQITDVRDFGMRDMGNQAIPYSTKDLSPGIYYFLLNLNNNSSLVKKVMIQ